MVARLKCNNCGKVFIKDCSPGGYIECPCCNADNEKDLLGNFINKDKIDTALKCFLGSWC